MTAPFPNHPYLSGLHHPCGFEASVPDLIIEGDFPKDLAGVFYRNGPDLYFPPRDDNYHWFDGDGMIFAFYIQDGNVSMRNRWAMTDKLELEIKEGRKLWGTFGNPMTSDMAAIGEVRYNTANTNIILHGGKLMALMEGAPPVVMDPQTLETLGEHTFNGMIDTTFSAHPKVDPFTGEMFSYGWLINGPIAPPEIRYDRISADGILLNSFKFSVPHRSMVHTFITTQNYVIFPILPLDVDGQRAMTGGPVTAWNNDRPSKFAVIPRDGTGDDIKWFEMDPRHMFHEHNAWDEDGKIVAIVAASDRAPLFPDTDGNLPDHSDAVLTLRRWEFDLSSGKITETALNDKDVQFPRADDRFMTLNCKQAFANTYMGASDAREHGLDSVMRMDVTNGYEDIYHYGENFAVGEVVFAPRLSSSDECDGYVMSLVTDKTERETALVIFDAMNISDGPIAKAKLPFRIPNGFHCNFYSHDSREYMQAFTA